ncbi:hypothetical protein MA16_Dca022127 [Dendrobium catenatum]|uniref:Uncharacterized protein n=1 Tax=Dendrobium catenatum TaxID=906689 RepID=A0A2I0VJ88_9ASPA|nr:hypothetical protein MA16_Dca022127 [Dendrobium catenatum]
MGTWCGLSVELRSNLLLDKDDFGIATYLRSFWTEIFLLKIEHIYFEILSYGVEGTTLFLAMIVPWPDVADVGLCGRVKILGWNFLALSLLFRNDLGGTSVVFSIKIDSILSSKSEKFKISFPNSNVFTVIWMALFSLSKEVRLRLLSCSCGVNLDTIPIKKDLFYVGSPVSCVFLLLSLIGSSKEEWFVDLIVQKVCSADVWQLLEGHLDPHFQEADDQADYHHYKECGITLSRTINPAYLSYPDYAELLQLSTTRDKVHAHVSLLKDARTIQHILHTSIIPKAGDRVHITPLLSLNTFYILSHKEFNATDMIFRYIEHLTTIRDPGHRRKHNLALGHLIAYVLDVATHDPEFEILMMTKNVV